MNEKRDPPTLPEKITVNVEVDVEDLVDIILRQMSSEQAIEFVQLVDKRHEDWEFTMALHEYFIGEAKKYHAETQEDQTSER